MGPQRGNVRDKRIVDIFVQARDLILLDFVTLLNDENINKNAEVALASKIASINSELGQKYGVWANLRMREEYLVGAFAHFDRKQVEEALETIKKLTAGEATEYVVDSINSQLGQVHTEAVEVLVDASIANMQTSLEGIQRNLVQKIAEVNKAKTSEALAVGIASGAGFQQQKDTLIQQFTNEGVTVLRDRAGRKWDLARYTDMLVRTDTAIAHNRGTINRGAEVGVFVYERFEAQDCCADICDPHRGELHDIRTDGNPVDIYHPNCRGFRIPRPDIS